nr:unnamed protein product [Callosobruchus analis]
MHKILKNWNDVVQENSNTALLKSESRVSNSERNDQEANVYVDYLFVTAEKLSSNARKRYENQVDHFSDADIFRYLILFTLT